MLTNPLRVHAIIIALNEEQFIEQTLVPLYEQCSGISVITQYDRNYYGERVVPDATVQKVLSFPDPAGKISLVVRRYTDEAVSRNHEMLALMSRPWQGVIPHHATIQSLAEQHASPDYFLIVDADEIFDVNTFPQILQHLSRTVPRIMKVEGYEYAGTWNRRVPTDVWTNVRVGFVKAGQLFLKRRVMSFWELKLRSAFTRIRLSPDLASRMMGIVRCPRDVGAFHHGGLVKTSAGIASRVQNHSERTDYAIGDAPQLQQQKCDWIPTSDLPENIRTACWPDGLIDRSEPS